MTESVPAKGELTSWLVAILRAALQDVDEDPLGIGDGIAPEAFGWPKGQPGVGVFRPYSVIKAMQSSPQRNPQAMATSQPDNWTIPYSITGWGQLREQADSACDQVNAVLAAVDLAEYRGDNSPVAGWQIQQLVVAPLGTTDRTDQTSPPMWSRGDVCTIWLARAQPRRRG